ncbi:MAG: AAA family ATPase [Candidatus Lokiarchaeota archaeon]|nr:AAA family ATPase [Candidatus Lokiarchaeota archaeon]
MCGLPASGKTKFANILASHLKDRFPTISVHIIDTDIIREKLFSQKFKPEEETKVRKNALEQTWQYLESDYVVIIDDINYYNSMRQDFKEIAEKLMKPFLIIHISTPLEYCLLWNQKRETPLEERIISQVAEKFDIPGEKYAWDVATESIDFSRDKIYTKLKSIVNKIENILYTPVKADKIEKNKEITSTIQELELISRNFIHFYSKIQFNSEKKDSINLHSAIADSSHLDIFEKLCNSSLFHQIQNKFDSNIEKINTERKNYLRNSQSKYYREIISLDEETLLNFLKDFMKFLLRIT